MDTLVSVCVITYNSSKYILATLESIKKQIYQNIELIISDDCSQDDTVSICKEWISHNSFCFVNVKLIESQINSGIAPNYNRAYTAAQGEWIKGIAGDDLLLPNCIVDNVNYVNKHKEVNVLFSNTFYFREAKVGIISMEHCRPKFDSEFWEKDASEQYNLLCIKNRVEAPTSFIKSSIYKAYLFNETYKMIEDYPFWLLLTKNGIKLYHLNLKTVMYRQEDSVTRSSSFLYSEKFEDSYYLFYLLELKEVLANSHPTINKYYQVHFICYNFALLVLKNKKTLFTKIINRIVCVILSMF